MPWLTTGNRADRQQGAGGGRPARATGTARPPNPSSSSSRHRRPGLDAGSDHALRFAEPGEGGAQQLERARQVVVEEARGVAEHEHPSLAVPLARHQHQVAEAFARLVFEVAEVAAISRRPPSVPQSE